MYDDEPKKSPEFLDETKPERNERSFFERLLGRESEEEKLRRKLDEELKEAARKRATDFEEERRVEEKREVSETRKLKKRWRAKLVEKSQKLLQEAAERGDEPVNGLEVARLMVAERIVKIHDMLQNEDLRRSEEKTLKIHIDFMGLLSEKIDRPELEVPEEVEQLYTTIAESVEAVTGETIPHETAPQPPVQPTAQGPEAAPKSEADTEYSLFASSIIRAIKKVIRPYTTNQSEGAGVGPNSQAHPTETTRPTERTTTPQEQETPRITEKLLSVVKAVALSSEVIRQEIFHAETVRKLANVVEKAEMMRIRPTAVPTGEKPPVRKLVEAVAPVVAASGIVRSEVSRDQPRRSPEPLSKAKLERTLAPSTPDKAPTTETRLGTKPSSTIEPYAPEKMPAPEVRIETNLGSQKRIKDMTELELTNLAKTIDIGNGRFLYDVYKRGEIDRESLIKVLESRKYGRDYRSELAFRRLAWRRHLEESQERLKKITTANAQSTPTLPTQNEPPEDSRQSTASLQKPTIPEQTSNKLRNIGRSLARPLESQAGTKAKRFVEAAQEQLKRQNQAVVLFTTVVLVLILLLVVISL